MQSKEYKLPNGKKAIFEYDITTGVGEVDLECMDKLMAMITDRPQGWIPVSERLPEESGNYLIAIADSNYKNGQFFEISWFYPSNHTWSFRNANVIAWMPLPEPYKAESEEEE